MHDTPPAVLLNVQHWEGVEAKDMVEGEPPRDGRIQACACVEVVLQGQVVTGGVDAVMNTI